jgi:uncharacterized protein HemX
MADPRGHLEVVSEDGEAPEAPPPAPAADRRRGWLVLALVALLALALVGLALESRRATELSARVERVSAELSATQAALRAHRSHLDQVRASVADLQALVERAPTLPPPEPR